MSSTLKKVAYLTMADPGDYVTDYHLSIEPLNDLGWEVSEVPWRSSPDWNQFDAVYMCTPWDYPQHFEEFKRVLAEIESSRAVLFNDLSIVHWNLEKTYMRDVEARGNDIVPSTWYEDFKPEYVSGFFEEHHSRQVVIKPLVGGNATDVFVLSNPPDANLMEKLERTFAGRRFFVQPFINNIQTEGEFSLFFFNGEYSHATVKKPREGDFRVQEEHGAEIFVITPDDTLLEVGHRVFSQIEPLPVYGRGDWVRGPDGRYLLMELELIEPSLYLRTDSTAPERFARAFNKRYQQISA